MYSETQKKKDLHFYLENFLKSHRSLKISKHAYQPFILLIKYSCALPPTLHMAGIL